MITAILPLLLWLHAGAPPAIAATTQTCPVETAQGRRIVTSFAGSDTYDLARSRYGVSRATADQVRPLTDPADAPTCAALMQALLDRAQAAGGSLAGSAPELYAVGTSYYYAVFPVQPSSCTAAPGASCIDTRWQALTIFDRQFSVVASVRI